MQLFHMKAAPKTPSPLEFLKRAKTLAQPQPAHLERRHSRRYLDLIGHIDLTLCIACPPTRANAGCNCRFGEDPRDGPRSDLISVRAAQAFDPFDLYFKDDVQDHHEETDFIRELSDVPVRSEKTTQAMAGRMYGYNQASSGSQAPEVVPGSSDLIPVPNDHQAPEAVYQQQSFLQDAYSTAPSYTPSPGYTPNEKSGVFYEDDANFSSTKAVSSSKRRKRLIWIAIGVILLLLAIGLGVGLGAGLSQSSKDDDSNAQDANAANT